jgi:hypothetical protein
VKHIRRTCSLAELRTRMGDTMAVPASLLLRDPRTRSAADKPKATRSQRVLAEVEMRTLP